MPTLVFNQIKKLPALLSRLFMTTALLGSVSCASTSQVTITRPATNSDENRSSDTMESTTASDSIQLAENNSGVAPGGIRWQNDYWKRPAYQQFVQEAVSKHKFKAQQLHRWFAPLNKRPDILAQMDKQAESLPWFKYQKIFLKNERIYKGVKFWNKHAKQLAAAEKKYGVPAEVIVAIVGVESLYGERKGQAAILESLSTLAFDYPRRADFFTKEMLQFLLLAREEKLDPVNLKGSYAGAMGMPQFISSSYRKYAVDFDGDGRRDLFASHADVIGSVANYFATFGWKRGEPIVTRAKLTPRKQNQTKPSQLRIEPHATIQELAATGIKPLDRTANYSNNEKVALLVLQHSLINDEYWLGFHNFYMISRYNHSTHYSMAVYQLSQRIAQARSQSGTNKDRPRRHKRKGRAANLSQR